MQSHNRLFFLLIAAYWLISFIAAFSPLSWAPAIDLPPLFSSLAARSPEPDHWQNYFSIMSIALLLAAPISFIIILKTISAPRTRHIVLLGSLIFAFFAGFLAFLLSTHVAPETHLIKFGGIVNSRPGLALHGSLEISLFTTFIYFAMAGLAAIWKHLAGRKAAP